MDIFTYVETRQVDLKDIFGYSQQKRLDDIHVGFKKLGCKMERKIKLWWDGVTIERYLEEGLVPRRLRWDVPPNDGLQDKESMAEWYTFFNNSGLELLRFLLKRKQRKLITVNQDINEIKNQLEHMQTTQEYLEASKSLKESITRFDQKICKIKSKKYNRDKNDYASGSIFKWQIKGETIIDSAHTSPAKDIPLEDYAKMSSDFEDNGITANKDSQIKGDYDTYRYSEYVDDKYGDHAFHKPQAITNDTLGSVIQERDVQFTHIPKPRREIRNWQSNSYLGRQRQFNDASFRGRQNFTRPTRGRYTTGRSQWKDGQNHKKVGGYKNISTSNFYSPLEDEQYETVNEDFLGHRQYAQPVRRGTNMRHWGNRRELEDVEPDDGNRKRKRF